MRRHLFDHFLWSLFQSSLHILHIINHAGPSVWAVIHLIAKETEQGATITLFITSDNVTKYKEQSD